MATVISALVRLKPENCHESEASQDIGWETNFNIILVTPHKNMISSIYNHCKYYWDSLHDHFNIKSSGLEYIVFLSQI